MATTKTQKKKITVEKYVIYIYLKGKKFSIAKSEPIDEEVVEVFYKEMNDSKSIMEFGDFYFAKSEFRFAKIKKIKIKREE